MKRRPAVAGQFYPGSKAEIDRMLAGLVDADAPKEKALGALSPHAGWIYSGRGAGMLFSRLEIPETVVVLCPNHRGAGADVAIMASGTWELPDGPVEIDADLAGRILDRCDFMEDDPRAHAQEHSLEVQLPFIRRFRPDFKLVPISLGRVSYEQCVDLSAAIVGAVASGPALVVASSDMTHFESAESAKRKDQLALDQLLKLDPEGLYRTVAKNRISMCGFIPATVMLGYALARGAREARLIDYRNSGDVTGDYSEVVAYATVIVK